LRPGVVSGRDFTASRDALRPLEPTAEWHEPEPTDLLFPKRPRDLFNASLEEEKLRTDRDGRPRTAYSLRHTYTCLRLLEGADIDQIAKTCRTSVEMIEKHYAAHLKTQLDAAAINIMRPRPKKKTVPKKCPGKVEAVRLAKEA
jgi:integrase